MYKHLILSLIVVLFAAYQTALGLKCNITNKNTTTLEKCNATIARNATNYLSNSIFQKVNKTENKEFLCLDLNLKYKNGTNAMHLQTCVFKNNSNLCNQQLNSEGSKNYAKGSCKLCSKDNCNKDGTGGGGGGGAAGNIVENYYLIITTGLFALFANILKH